MKGREPEPHLTFEDEPLEFCASCGMPLTGDFEDDPTGDAGLPICGECNRERNFAAIEEVELLDRELDDA